jgi:glycosyltransferase involved in cell wall biosynthesis
VLIILDADGQHNPDCMPKLTKPILSGEADIVIGSRFIENTSKIPAYRVMGMKVLDKLTNLSGHKEHKVSDSQSGYRAYSRNAYANIYLTEKGMGVGSEILMKAHEQNMKITEVPITVRYDVSKHSNHPITHGFNVAMTIVRTISQRRPLLFFGVTGLIMLLFGLFFGFHVIDMYNRNQGLPVGNALIAVTLTITGSFTMLTGIILYALEDSIRRAIGKNK